MASTNQKILIVDDEPDIRELLSHCLKKVGYSIDTASNGQDGIYAAIRFRPQLILIDLMMPIMGGIEACTILRNMVEFRNTFIVFLTARNDEHSEISGLDAGADDYILKPVKPHILVNRINAILRRKNFCDENPGSKIHISNLMIDSDSNVVSRDGDTVTLPSKEFELLYLLASKPGKVFTTNMILKSVWNNTIVAERTIDVHINRLREKLGGNYINTIKGIGYKFVV